MRIQILILGFKGLTIDIQEVCFCPQIASISQGGQSHRRTAVSYKLEWLVKNK